MITRIEATDYRCFKRLWVGVSDFQVLAGANGSGKTTLLDVPVVIGDLLRSRNVAAAFLERIQDRGARAGSLTQLPFGSDPESFGLALEAAFPPVFWLPTRAAWERGRPPTHLRYELRLRVEDGRRLLVERESLSVIARSEAGDDGDRRDVIRRDRSGQTVLRPEAGGAPERSSRLDSTLLALPRLQYEAAAEFPAGRWLLELLTGEVIFFDPTWPDLRRASPPGLPSRLLPSGLNLPWLALRLQAEQPKRFSSWVEHVQTALPQISSISVREREEDHHAYFRVSYEGGFEVSSSGLSEGTLRIFALTLVAYVDDPPRMLIVEEPENSIHPQAIDTVMQSLRSLYDSQVWVSTHSPIVLADRQLAELLICRMDRSGAVEVIAGPQHPRLKEWKGAIDLGSLFAAGIFE